MSVFEELFESATLEVVVPDTSIEFPTQADADNWLTRVQSGEVERKQAFFGESHDYLLHHEPIAYIVYFDAKSYKVRLTNSRCR